MDSQSRCGSPEAAAKKVGWRALRSAIYDDLAAELDAIVEKVWFAQRRGAMNDIVRWAATHPLLLSGSMISGKRSSPSHRLIITSSIR